MGDFTVTDVAPAGVAPAGVALADVARIALAWRGILFYLTAKDLSALVRAMPGALARCLESLPPRHISLLRGDLPADITVAELEYSTENVSNQVHAIHVRRWASANNVPAILYALRHKLVSVADVLSVLPTRNAEISATIIKEEYDARCIRTGDVIRLGDEQLLAYVADQPRRPRWFSQPSIWFYCWPSLEFLKSYARVSPNLNYVHTWITSDCVLPPPECFNKCELAQLLISLNRLDLARPLIEYIAANGWFLNGQRDSTLVLWNMYSGIYSLTCRTQDMAVAVSGIFK